MTGRDVLVGSTGFVGGNLLAQRGFGLAVHTSDVTRAFGSNPDLLIYAGVPSAMFLANRNPEADLVAMRAARENIRRIGARRIVLVSTIAVYADSRGRDEGDDPAGPGLSAYGANRLQLERWVREDFSGSLVIRLPALYGEGIRKNFVRDLAMLAPALLSEERYRELSKESCLVASSYRNRGDGFFGLASGADLAALKAWFADSPFNALSFTDSRSRFQFYGLGRLWTDIAESLEEGREIMNLCPPPVSAAEVHSFVCGWEWRNELDVPPFDYDLRSRYTPLPSGRSGYLCDKREELGGIATFVKRLEASL